MKKFIIAVLSLVTICPVFLFGCDSPDKNNEERAKQPPLNISYETNISRQAHYRKNGAFVPHMPIHSAPLIRKIPRKSTIPIGNLILNF